MGNLEYISVSMGPRVEEMSVVEEGGGGCLTGVVSEVS